ncbi:MAG: signal peptidase I [Clostridiales bacterium]|nr:signal peptidase I [Clostridiales bacterium]
MEDEEVYLEEASDESENLNESKRTGWSVKRLLFDIVFYALLIFVSVYIIPNYVLQRTVVDGESMENTLFDGDHLYVEKISYRFDKLDRFDIIVFYPYGRDDDQYYVKRIIGLPGETVQIIDGLIYIDGQVLEEHYGNETILDPGRARDLIELGDDEYFVMGDNRNISKDSRHPSVGNVKKHNIGGKAFFRVSPIKEFGPID